MKEHARTPFTNFRTAPGVSDLYPSSDAIFQSKQILPSPIGSPIKGRGQFKDMKVHFGRVDERRGFIKPYDLFMSESLEMNDIWKEPGMNSRREPLAFVHENNELDFLNDIQKLYIKQSSYHDERQNYEMDMKDPYNETKYPYREISVRDPIFFHPPTHSQPPMPQWEQQQKTQFVIGSERMNHSHNQNPKPRFGKSKTHHKKKEPTPDDALGGNTWPRNKKNKKNKEKNAPPKEDLSKFEIHLDKVLNGDDMRTTLMIKNIANKYSQELLLEAIDRRFKGTYDFFYLPIDSKNKCNVGYAFINFLSVTTVVKFVEEFNNKKWEKFNSEKVCQITYARIQGKTDFINHFCNSNLMNEEPSCRPLIFTTQGSVEQNFPPAIYIPPQGQRANEIG